MNSVESQTNLPKIESKNEENAATDSSNDATKSKLEIYVNALVHSANCTQESCTFVKCLQFKRVTRHNKNCKNFINDRCEFCRELIALSVYHAKNCTNHSDCLVPFCKTIKQKLEIKKSIEFIANLLNALKYKTKKCQGVQTITGAVCMGTNKRKYASLESEENNLQAGCGSSFFEDFELKSKNDEMQQRKDEFYEKLKEIKEKQESNELKNDNKGQLSKLIREKVFASFFQQILINNPQFKESRTPRDKDYSRTPRDKDYANLIVLLLRKEAQLNEMSDEMSYLYLVTEMFFSFDTILSNYKKVSTVCVEVQTDECTTTTTNESTTSTDEINQIPNKRLKLE